MAPSTGTLVLAALTALLVVGSAAWTARHYALATTLRRTLRVFRIDASAVAVGGALLAGAVVVVARVGTPAAPFRSVGLALSLLVAALGLTVVVANLDWYRAARSLPVLAPDEVEPGPVQVSGTVAEDAERVESAVTQTATVAYRAATLEEHAVLGRGQNGSVWSPTATAFETTPFALAGGPPDGDRTDAASATAGATDDAPNDAERAARVTVDGEAAAYPLLSPSAPALEYTPAGSHVEGLERIVSAEPGTTAPVSDALGRGTRSRPRRYSERRIDVGDDVYVLGTAERTDDGGLRIVDDPDGPPLLVARCSPDVVRAHLRHLVVHYGLVSLAALAVAGWLASGLL